MRKLIIGMPPCVTQQGLKSNKVQIYTRGKVNLAVPEGDPKITNRIEASLYDTKPIHYTGMVSEELKWVIKEKVCFNVEMVEVKILYYYA